MKEAFTRSLHTKHCLIPIVLTLIALAAVLAFVPGCFFGQSDDDGPVLPGPSQVRELVREVSGIRALSVSPDGSKLVYVSFVDSDEDERYLVVRDARKGSAVNLMEYSPITSAIWGPDGTSIAYLAHDTGRQNKSIGIMADDTLEMQSVVDLLSYDTVSTPAWSPDGRFIAFWSRKSLDEKTAESTLWMMRPDGNDLKQLYGGPGVKAAGTITGDIAWSPDNSKLLFAMSNGGWVNAFIQERRGGDPKNLTDNQLKVSDLFWSPTGKRIGYASVDKNNPNGPPKVWVMNADGSRKESLGPYGRPVGWVPNSGELVYIALDNSPEVPWPSPRLEAIDVKTKAIRRLVEEQDVNIVAATVAGDSRVFYVTADQEGLGKIMVVE